MIMYVIGPMICYVAYSIHIRNADRRKTTTNASDSVIHVAIRISGSSPVPAHQARRGWELAGGRPHALVAT